MGETEVNNAIRTCRVSQTVGAEPCNYFIFMWEGFFALNVTFRAPLSLSLIKEQPKAMSTR